MTYRRILVNRPDYSSMTGNELVEELRSVTNEWMRISGQMNEIRNRLSAKGYSKERIINETFVL